jgi:hypothetical protein
MACHIRIALLFGAMSAAAVSSARADDCPKPTGPVVRTIKVTECVAETYQVKRTCYRMECKTETYDTFRCETVCEPRERVCTVVRRVPEYKTTVQKVCCNVVTCEDRVHMQKCYEYRTVTCMVKKCVSRGHWECREECRQPGCLEKLCNPCACPHTVTRRHWVSCPEYQECPVTRCQKVCVEKPVCCKVRVCKQVMKDVPVQTCTYRCVEEKQVVKEYVQVTHRVPCKATRTVHVCVPYTVTETCCRMVPRVVERQVVECCPTTCCTSCCVPCCQERRRFCCGNFRRVNDCGGCCH